MQPKLDWADLPYSDWDSDASQHTPKSWLEKRGKRQNRLHSFATMRLSDHSSSGDSSVQSILDDYNPEDLEKTDVQAVAFVVVIMFVVWVLVVAVIITIIVVLPAGYQGRLITFGFCKVL